MLDASTEANLAKVVDEARDAFGDDLVSVVVYGSAAGEADFVAGRSDINLAIVVEAIGMPELEALAACLPRWHRRKVATPLFIDRTFLAGACDVFPMEILDIQNEHSVLFGAEVFAGLAVDRDHLRHQIEYEARAKLLRLRVQFAETGGKRAALKALMVDSVASFAALMRALLRWRGADAPAALLPLLDRFEADAGVLVPGVRDVARVKLGQARWHGEAVDAFRAYLADVETLVRLADRLQSGAGEVDAD